MRIYSHFDYKNRLIKVIQNEVIKVDENGNIIETIPEQEIVNFTYDILGRRIEKKTQDKTINYIYAGQNAIKEITTNNTTNQIIETRENTYSNELDDILSTTITDYTTETPITKTYFYEKNHLGSITKISDTTGAIIEQYEYDAFGVAYASINNIEAVTEAQSNKTLNIKKAEGSESDNGESDELVIDNIRYKRYNGIGKIGNTRLYTGREYDAELKLYYNRARYYSPDLGRFINRDPIDVADDVNLYAYVGNNGVMFVDKMGLGKVLIFVGTDKQFFGMNFGVLEKAKNIQYNNYLEEGYKKGDIEVIYGSSIEDFINAIGENKYKEIGLIAHSSNNGIVLNANEKNDLTVINDSTLNNLPKYGNETIITIIGCLAGQGDNSIAEKISEQMGVTVVASDSIIMIGDDGYFIDGGDGKYDIIEGTYHNIIGKKSDFKIFTP